MDIKKISVGITALAVSITAVSVTAFVLGFKVPITEKYFPDENFREYVKRFDTDGNGFLSQNERDAVTEIDALRMEITSVKGIKYFQNLEKLSCGYNDLTKLDVSKNTKLTYIDCSYNDLKKLM